MKRTVSDYLSLPYTRRVRVELEDTGERYFVAYIEELDGVEADGEDPIEAFLNLQSAFEDYLSAMIGRGNLIPEPTRWPSVLGHDPVTTSPQGVVSIASVGWTVVQPGQAPRSVESSWMPEPGFSTDETRPKTHA